MLSLEENIRAVLECHFSQCKEELIDSAVDNICHLVTVERGILNMIDICFDCKYYVDGMCTQYDIVVAPTDGCSNGEKKGAIRNEKS